MRNDKRKAQNESAANGLTRREMNADLTAKDIGFDPYAPIEEIAALHASIKGPLRS